MSDDKKSPGDMTDAELNAHFDAQDKKDRRASSFKNDWLIKAVEDAALEQAKKIILARGDFMLYGFDQDKLQVIVKAAMRKGLSGHMSLDQIKERLAE